MPSATTKRDDEAGTAEQRTGQQHQRGEPAEQQGRLQAVHAAILLPSTIRGTSDHGRCSALPAAQVDRPGLDDRVAAHQVQALVQRDGRVDVRGQHPHPVADLRPRLAGANVMCSSEQNHTVAPGHGRVAVVHARAP